MHVCMCMCVCSVCTDQIITVAARGTKALLSGTDCGMQQTNLKV